MSRQQPASADRTVSGARAQQRHGRSLMLALMLGLAFVLVLGHERIAPRPATASISTLDTGPDQSTGPTDPNGPPY